jgi:hypothetical protein
MVTIGVGFDKGHLQLTSTSAAPPPAAPSAPPANAWQVPNDGHNDIAVLAISAVGTAGVGMLIRGLQKRSIANPKDIALDAAVGAELGACMVGTPQAESVCYGVLGGLPLQIINRLRDPKWDFRIGLLATGALSLARSELGGNPIFFSGYRVAADGTVSLQAPELIANAAVDTASDASFYALSNTAAALLQGYKLKDLPAVVLAGASYGGGQALLDNVVLGAPLKLSEPMKQEAIALDKSNGGPDVSGVVRFTTFRAGGVLQLAMQGSTITLGRNVSIQPFDITSEVAGHELIHRTQIAGSPANGRDGTGLLSFYGQYLSWAPKGYENIPYEREAYHYADGLTEKPYTEGAQIGDFVAAPVALSLFALPATLMPPP